MIDMGCFDRVANEIGAPNDGRHRRTVNPHPQIAEEQALLLDLGNRGGACALSAPLIRSPHPRVVEEQFKLGIK